MKLIRGTNVYPRAVEAIVREYPEVDEFQIRLCREDGIRDEITVRVELGAGPRREQWDEHARRLREDLAAQHEGLRFNVERVEPRLAAALRAEGQARQGRPHREGRSLMTAPGTSGKDLLGNDLTAEEARLLAAWEQLKALPCRRPAALGAGRGRGGARRPLAGRQRPRPDVRAPTRLKGGGRRENGRR